MKEDSGENESETESSRVVSWPWLMLAIHNHNSSIQAGAEGERRKAKVCQRITFLTFAACSWLLGAHHQAADIYKRGCHFFFEVRGLRSRYYADPRGQ